MLAFTQQEQSQEKSGIVMKKKIFQLDIKKPRNE